MTEISCLATRLLLDALDAGGVSTEGLTDGTGLSEPFLRDPRNFVAWDTFTELCDRVEARVGGPAAMERLGASTVHLSSFGILRRFASAMITPRQLARVAFHWVAPALWPHLESTMEEPSTDRFVLRIGVPAGLRGSTAYFHLCLGCVAEAPTLLGRPASRIEADVTPRSAVFTVFHPPEPSLRIRSRRAVVARIRVGPLLDELAEQQATLNEQYRALLRSRTDFREVISRLPQGVAIHREGRLVWVNAAMVSLLGYEQADELVGRHVLDLVAPEDRAAVTERLRNPPTPSPEDVPQRYVILRRDGERRQGEISQARSVDFEGAPARIVVVVDVTERERVHEKMMFADRMASLGMMSAGIAHEINNPLAYAYGSVELALAALDDPDGRTSAKESLATALEGMERVRGIVGDLKTFSRPDGETLEPVDVHAVLDATLNLAGVELRRVARVVRDYGHVSLVRASRARLGQVFLNLLMNAADALPSSGGGVIRVTTSVDPGGRVLVEVADTGQGIPAGALGRIFEPFFTTKPGSGGTGLGLAICHRIVTQLGGEIAVQSTPDAPEFRTTFRVALLPATPGGVASPAPMTRPVARRARVLLVDDEPSLLDVVRLTLGRTHEVVALASAEAALEVLASDAAFDVLLVDVMMPGLGGKGLFETLSSRSPALAERIVFMTGGAFHASIRDFLAHVPNRCLEKPFRLAELEAVVQERIGSSRGTTFHA